MGLNCVGPLIHGYFSVNTAVLHDSWLVESADAKPDYAVFNCTLTPMLSKDQMYICGEGRFLLRNCLLALVYVILGLGKSEICRVGQQVGN